MRFYADLHVHSKYSLATSRDADLEHLFFWAAVKGLHVIATGDFAHPAWRAELKEKLAPAEEGLFRLKPDIEEKAMATLPKACRRAIRFILSVEVSTIYKKGDKTRKVHHLIYMPDFAGVDALVAKLSRIGNLNADGRPILGLDSRHLLEIVLESSSDGFLIPAHIWTPWFAAMGSKSGFDCIDDCYGDLSEHIFAVETGLSSDPAMNHRVSSLDRFRLVSNSDAHSPLKLGREATAFDGEMSYSGIRHALQTGEGYVGTVEFFPEEGKYHLDGHRKCNLRLTPEETQAHGGRCPVCGGPLTVGVMHRIDVLADRAEGEAPPPTAGEAKSLVPLPEILSELLDCGTASQKVQKSYHCVIDTLGDELTVLGELPAEEIDRADPLLAEAITRLRAGRVIREAGYDGEYGVIRVFERGELAQLKRGGVLFSMAEARGQGPAAREKKQRAGLSSDLKGKAEALRENLSLPSSPRGEGVLGSLDEEQRQAAETSEGPLVVVAGPGSGKTRMLTHRIAHLVAERGVASEACLAVTFTRRAAAEMRERLETLLPGQGGRVAVHTFHSLGCLMLRENPGAAGLQRGFAIIAPRRAIEMAMKACGVAERKARELLRAVSLAKRTGEVPADIKEAFDSYQHALALANEVDFDDLIRLSAQMLEDDPALAARWRGRFTHVSVDEFQDVDAQQYRLIRLLTPDNASLCVIGDPNQAIYGFRGASAAYFRRFAEDYPQARTVRLHRNYRSRPAIVVASSQVIGATEGEALAMLEESAERITIHAAATERAEAEFVVQAIEQLIGGQHSFSINSGRAEPGREMDIAFADIAVLYRTEAQAEALAEALHRSGMPFARHGHSPLAEQPQTQAILTALEEAEGATLAERLEAAARATGGGAEASPALAWLQAVASDCGGDAQRFRQEAALATEADLWDPRAEKISLLTLHAAKGLEFPVVFITGLEEGVLPLAWGAITQEALEEERRLFFVGMTRAQERLFLTRAEKRLWRGVPRVLPPSPFLTDIERRLLEISARRPLAKKEKTRQLELF